MRIEVSKALVLNNLDTINAINSVVATLPFKQAKKLKQAVKDFEKNVRAKAEDDLNNHRVAYKDDGIVFEYTPEGVVVELKDEMLMEYNAILVETAHSLVPAIGAIGLAFKAVEARTERFAAKWSKNATFNPGSIKKEEV